MKPLKLINLISRLILSIPTHSGNLECTLTAVDRVGDAIEAFRKSIQLNSNRSVAFNNMRNLSKLQSKIGEAIEAYKMSLKLSLEVVL